MEKLILVKPSKNIESSIQEYKQEFLDSGESRINGSCGITFLITSIVGSKLHGL